MLSFSCSMYTELELTITCKWWSKHMVCPIMQCMEGYLISWQSPQTWMWPTGYAHWDQQIEHVVCCHRTVNSNNTDTIKIKIAHQAALLDKLVFLHEDLSYQSDPLITPHMCPAQGPPISHPSVHPTGKWQCCHQDVGNSKLVDVHRWAINKGVQCCLVVHEVWSHWGSGERAEESG